MSRNWDDLAVWWSGEVESDSSYEHDVHPILCDLLPDHLGVTMDLGCGEGQGMRIVEGEPFGCDLSLKLLSRTALSKRVVQAELPDLRWLADSVLDTAYAVYLLDLIKDHSRFFSETSRTVRSGGSLVVVINHPVYTAPGSSPVMDTCGEVMWRWGSYFKSGSSREPAGESEVEFFHRSMGELLNSAASESWALDRVEERGLSAETIERLPSYVGQEEIPRLLGIRWIRK